MSGLIGRWVRISPAAEGEVVFVADSGNRGVITLLTEEGRLVRADTSMVKVCNGRIDREMHGGLIRHRAGHDCPVHGEDPRAVRIDTGEMAFATTAPEKELAA